MESSAVQQFLVAGVFWVWISQLSRVGLDLEVFFLKIPPLTPCQSFVEMKTTPASQVDCLFFSAWCLQQGSRIPTDLTWPERPPYIQYLISIMGLWAKCFQEKWLESQIFKLQHPITKQHESTNEKRDLVTNHRTALSFHNVVQSSRTIYDIPSFVKITKVKLLTNMSKIQSLNFAGTWVVLPVLVVWVFSW